MNGKLGYIFFTICIGLVCFYIGRVEFLAEKLQEAEKYQRMARPNQLHPQRANSLQPFPEMRPVSPVRNNFPNQKVIPGRPGSNPFSNQDPNVVNQRDQTIKLWETAEEIVQTRKDVVSSDLSAAASVMVVYILFI